LRRGSLGWMVWVRGFFRRMVVRWEPISRDSEVFVDGRSAREIFENWSTGFRCETNLEGSPWRSQMLARPVVYLDKSLCYHCYIYTSIDYSWSYKQSGNTPCTRLHLKVVAFSTPFPTWGKQANNIAENTIETLLSRNRYNNWNRTYLPAPAQTPRIWPRLQCHVLVPGRRNNSTQNVPIP
jgi:hypothetical protein